MTFSYRRSAANSARISVPRISYSFPTNAVLDSIFPPIPGGSLPFHGFLRTAEERRTSDVAVTNYLGLSLRERDPLPRGRRPPLPVRRSWIPRPPSRYLSTSLPSLPSSPLFFPSARHFCGAKRDTYMDFVTGVRFAAQDIPLYAGPLFCTG